MVSWTRETQFKSRRLNLARSISELFLSPSIFLTSHLFKSRFRTKILVTRLNVALPWNRGSIWQGHRRFSSQQYARPFWYPLHIIVGSDAHPMSSSALVPTQYHRRFCYPLHIIVGPDTHHMSSSALVPTPYHRRSWHLSHVIIRSGTHSISSSLFSWRYNPFWLYFHSPVAGFSLLVFEVSWSHTTTRHSR
jgi:hypothetical protein